MEAHRMITLQKSPKKQLKSRFLESTSHLYCAYVKVFVILRLFVYGEYFTDEDQGWSNTKEGGRCWVYIEPYTIRELWAVHGKPGAKLQNPEMSEFEALRKLVSKRLMKLFRARAEAYFADHDIPKEYDADGL